MDQKKWDRLVAEGQKLATALSVDKFGLGDKALEVAPMGADTTNTGGLAKLNVYAEAIGIKFESLRAYRAVAAAWPEHDRNLSCASFSVHQDLASSPNRVTILKRLVKRAEKAGLKRVPQNWVRQEIGKAPTGQAIRSPDQSERPSIDAVTAAMKDPDIAFKVMAEPSVRKTVYEVDADRIEGARQRNREEFPQFNKFEDAKAGSDATKETHQAVLNLKHAIEYLRRVDVSPLIKDDLLSDLGQIRMLVEELERVVEGIDITPERVVEGRR